MHVSIRSLQSLESFTAIQMIVAIIWKPGLRKVVCFNFQKYALTFHFPFIKTILTMIEGLPINLNYSGVTRP